MKNTAEKMIEGTEAKGHLLTDGVKRDDPDRDWYVVRSATRQETRAEAGLIEAGMAVYVPRLVRYQVVRRVGGDRRVEVSRPLFEGYLFVGLGPGASLYQVKQVDGVHGVVRFAPDQEPRPVPYREVAKFLNAELAGRFDRTRRQAPALNAGDQVKIVSGPFSGFGAEFVKMRSGERIEVLMCLFGRVGPMGLRRDQVCIPGQCDNED